eukprot:GEMP01065248.1.p2 GENE.GEMP01065248.1~~GEMP01065248.1.p2  ORF type:complete len:190 (+),score=71.14 GEMP01065248.1:205-774(+)
MGKRKAEYAAFDLAKRNEFVLGFRKRKEHRRQEGHRRKAAEKKAEITTLKKENRQRIQKEWKNTARETRRALAGITGHETDGEEEDEEEDPPAEEKKNDVAVNVFADGEESDDQLFPNATVTTTLGLIEHEPPPRPSKRIKTPADQCATRKKEAVVPKKKKKKKKKRAGTNKSTLGPHKKDKKKKGKKR